MVSLVLIPLLHATILSDDCRNAVKNQKYAAEIFYSKNLYGYDCNIKDQPVSFLVKVTQAHVKGVRENKDLLKAIASDMNKIIDDESTQADDKLAKGLLGTLAEYWYFNKIVSNETDSSFKRVGGGIVFNPEPIKAIGDAREIEYFKAQLLETVGESYDYRKTNYYRIKEDLYSMVNSGEFTNYVFGDFKKTLDIGVVSDSDTFIWGQLSQSITAKGGNGNDLVESKKSNCSR